MFSFHYATYINTTPEQLWNALTNPEFTQRYWWGRRLQSDWKVGSEIKAIYDTDRIDWLGRVLAYQPNTKLSYTFHLEEKPDLRNDQPSIVAMEISPAGHSVVKLTVTHDNLSERGFEDVSNGWPAILSSVKSLLEAGKSLEYANV